MHEMHVLYLIDSLSASGGAEQSLAAMAPLLVQKGVALDVAYLRERPGLEAQLERAGATLFPLSGPRAGAALRVARLIRRRRPDLVHTTLFEADVAGRLAALVSRVPSVSSLVNASYGPTHVGDPSLQWWKVRAAQLADIGTARSAVRFHAVAGHVADAMATRLLIPRYRIDVIHRGRDPHLLGRRTAERREHARAAMGIDPMEPMVLAAARHEHQKGLDVLVAAVPRLLAQVPAARVVVAGREGNQTPALQRAVEKLRLGDSIRFLGARDDVGDLLTAADLVVLPSRWEGIPGTAIEALALETPIVASDIPGVRAVVGSSGGLLARLVPSGEPDALADAIVTTLGTPDAATEVARRGRDHFLRSFTVAHSVDRMQHFYRRSLAETRCRRRQTVWPAQHD